MFQNILCFIIFFFQAEDGIRDYDVTGVQTCALPILIAVSSVDGGLYNAAGLGIARLQQYQEQTGGISGFDGGGQISNRELLALECDVLVPAAIDNVITEDNADDIKAHLILEAANHPITPEADRILSEGARKGVG